MDKSFVLHPAHFWGQDRGKDPECSEPTRGAASNGNAPQVDRIMGKRSTSPFAFFAVAACVIGLAGFTVWAGEKGSSQICRPSLGTSPTIELGRAGQFRWTCVGGKEAGNGHYIVFIRPSGTYVLLKVPRGRTSFEFTPDTPGLWRWIVINTDPDRTKPDLESEPGFFQVVKIEDPQG